QGQTMERMMNSRSPSTYVEVVMIRHLFPRDGLGRGHYLSLVCAGALALSLGARPAKAGHCPNLVVLLDQSASMAQTPAGAQPRTGEKSKWDIAVAELTTLVSKYDGFLPVGYSNFPYRNASCDTRGFYVTTTGKKLTPSYTNRQDIYDAMHAFPTAYPFSGG